LGQPMSDTSSIPLTSDMNLEQLLVERILTIIPNAVRYACYRYNHIPSQCELEDFCHDIVVLLIKDDYRQLRAYKGKSSIKTWIYTIVIRHVKHQLHINQKSTSLEELVPDFVACSPTQENVVLDKERRESVQRALVKLPKRSQKLFELSLDGLSDLEISHLIGISTDAVRKQRYDLVKKIKRLLK
jgi:RNA polymerase sigma factor (sigma-70 family)